MKFQKINYLFHFLLLIFLVLTGFMSGCQKLNKANSETATSAKPNIIFILTDDFGWGDLGAFYQNQRKKANDRSEPWQATPNLDRLAASGAQLPHHYTAAPVCAPARASLLLGVSQGHANVRDNQFDKALEDNHTMASVLRKAGYATAAFGKWGLQGDSRWSGNGDEWPGHPLNRGFDYFLGYMRHRDGHEHYPKEGIYRGSKEVWQNRTDIASKLDKSYTADLWTAAAKRWIVDHVQNKNNEEPFFVYLAYDTPHAVLELPTQAYPGGGGLRGGLQWTGEAGHMINTASGEVDSWVHSDYADATYDDDNDPSTPEVPWPDVYKRYATANRRIDSGVGDITQLLKDLDIDSNTMIVFTSDNGPSKESYLPAQYQPNEPTFFDSFGPFDGIKRDTWEGGVRMPTLAYWPDHIPAGRVVNTPSVNYDWLPTFADAAGVPVPARSDGVSLLPSLTGKRIQQEGLVYVEYFNRGITPDYKDFAPQHRGRRRNQMQVLRLGDYVGVRYNIQSSDDDFEIYNVRKDPRETNNLANNPEQSPLIRELQQKMKKKVLQVRMPNTSAPRPYDDELIPPVTGIETTNGIEWKAYDGSFPWVPQVAALDPAESGKAKRPVIEVREKDNQALYFEGYLNIPSDGSYTFFLSTDTGGLLRIHEAAVIDADFGYTGGTEREGKIRLKAGLHPFRLYYVRRTKGKSSLKLQWSGPGISKQPVPTDVFVRRSNRTSSN